VKLENESLYDEERRFGRTPRGRRMNRFERETAQFVLSRLQRNSRVVDVPCGTGRFSDIIKGEGHRYVGVDLNLGNARHAASRLNVSLPTVQASLLELPLADNSADFVLCIRMFHHFSLKQIERALQEMSRTAPQCLVTFYNRRTWRVQKRRFSLRVRRKALRGGEAWDAKTYSAPEMARLVQKAGLRIKQKIPSTSFFTTNQFLWLERD
jgi:SAM-dependent methyltransferase